jgi:bifunctional NMN adenylyltransferase/nudix hydrolase
MDALPSADLAVLVGRFQPFHAAHLALLRHALSIAPRCAIVIGSAHQARTPRNPFTWTERAEMIRLAVPEAERERRDVVGKSDAFVSAHGSQVW